MTRPPLPVVLRTVARLELQQIAWRPWGRFAPSLARRFASAVRVAPGAIERLHMWSEAATGPSAGAAIREAENLLGGRPRYVGVTDPRPDFRLTPPFPSRLWGYELHYRRWLEGLALMVRRGAITPADVSRPRDRAEEFSREASLPWEPYVLARRVMNEAAATGLMAASLAGGERDRWMRDLARETGVLARLTESHIGANHELTHAAAVVALMLLLEGLSKSAVRGLKRYQKVLRSQVDANGLHIERSPAYHLVVFADLLRVIAACEAAGADAGSLPTHADSMRAALSLLLHSDGSLPMFHDSPAIVRPAAADFGIVPSGATGGYDLPRSGFCGWRGEFLGTPLHIVADYGSPRPRHQPGHQHAAPFVFELWWGTAVITGAGISTYEAGAQRLFERGAAAQASVRIDGRDPAELWSAFRMGRGFEVTGRNVDASPDGWMAAAAHDGFGKDRRHARTISWNESTHSLEITDRIDGRSHGRYEAFFPIGPGLSVVAGEDRSATIAWQDRQVKIHAARGMLTIEPFPIYREFGVAEPGHRITITDDASFPYENRIVLELG